MSVQRKRKLQDVPPMTPTGPRLSKRQRGHGADTASFDSTPTPRFSTTFKTFAEPSTHGVHKTRCVCVPLKEAEKEREAVLRRSPGNAAALDALDKRIAELRQRRCAQHETTLTRAQIHTNKARVEEHTLHGRQRRLRDVRLQQQQARKEGAEEEAQARHRIQVLERACLKAIHDRIEERVAVGFAEEDARAGVRIAHQDACCLLFEELRVGQRRAVVLQEARLRAALEGAEAVALTGFAQLWDLLCQEGVSRAAVVAEWQGVAAAAAVARTQGVEHILATDEAMQRSVVREREADCRAVLRRAAVQHHGVMLCVLAPEGGQRRRLHAEEGYAFDEILSAAESSLPRAVLQAEVAGRHAIAWEEHSECGVLFAGAAAALFATQGAEAHVALGASLLGELAALTASAVNSLGASHRAALEEQACRALYAIRASEEEVCVRLRHFFDTEHGLVAAREMESAGRAAITAEYASGVEGAYRFLHVGECAAMQAACERTFQECVVVPEAAEWQHIRGVFLQDAAGAVLQEEEAYARRSIAAACEQELAEGCSLRCADRVGMLVAAHARSRAQLEREEEMTWIQDMHQLTVIMADLALLNNVDHERGHRQEIVEEEHKAFHALREKMQAGLMLLLVNLDDFNSLRAFLNVREMQMALPQWGVEERRVLHCAANADMMSLMQHTKSLLVEYDRHRYNQNERHQAKVNQLLKDLNSSKAAHSRTTAELDELDVRYRDEFTRHAKVRKAHEQSKLRCEQLTRENRSTASTNEITRLERKNKELQRDLDAARGALDTERVKHATYVRSNAARRNANAP